MTQRYLFITIFSLLSVVARAQSIEYVRNAGQWKGDFEYKATTATGDVFLSEKSMTFLVGHAANHQLVESVKHGGAKDPVTLLFHAYRVHFEGAATPKVTGSKEQSWYYNYFLGKDPSKWKSGIHPALGVDYAGLYPGVDMHISSEKGHMKYEFIVAPGADPAMIRLRYEGQEKLSIQDEHLVIKTSIGDVQELKPYVYQYLESGKKVVPCRYAIKGQTLTYDLYKGYDATKPLVIDPTIVFSTFTGSTADNWGYTATYDAAGNFYGGGAVFDYSGPGGGYPADPGAFQSRFGGGVNDPASGTGDAHGLGIACDIGVIKYNSTGTTKIYASFIGGSDNEVPHSMVVDANNNLIVGGKTNSSNYPVTAAGYDTSYNRNGDIVITKLNATGTALIGSTYLGGTGRDGSNFSGSSVIYGNLKYNYGDDARSEVLVDRAGNIYLAGCTNSTDFPVTANASQKLSGGGQDAVITKLNNTLSTLIWSTYLGGTQDDAGYVMALDNSENYLYVGGGTMSADFPATGGTWRVGYQGGSSDGYIARYQNNSTYALEKVCFVGTPNQDQVYGVQVDLDDNVYAMGQSLGGAFPVTSGVYSNPNSSQFVIKLNKDLATNIYSTVYGSGDPSRTNISPVAFLVDTCQNVYISGWGGPLSSARPTIGNTTGMPVTPNALQSTTDGYDFYFIVFSRNASSLLYGTFYGRHSTNAGLGEHVDGGTSRFDKNGVVYQAICGGCGGTAGPPLPTTAGSFSPLNGSTNCNLASLKIAFELGQVIAQANASPTARGCPPLTVQFQNNSTNATNYLWDFRDGSQTSSLPAPTHTFTRPGVYRVMLVATNPNACKPVDTSYTTITVDSARTIAGYNLVVTDSCGPYRIALTNTSQYSQTPGSTSFTRFTWDFGDGTTTTGANPGTHDYNAPGTYTVTMRMIDSTACNSPETVSKTITINSLRVTAAFNIPDSICVGVPLDLNDNSTNAVTRQWAFGDGRSSTQTAVRHVYTTPGTYTVVLTSRNPAACNLVDSASRTIFVSPVPNADFSFAPIIPVPNTAIDFTNKSTDATNYVWSFGDNSGSNEVNPSHLYRKSGKYTVCLVAYNKGGCADTVCKQVEADVLTRAELPTAFSPNGDGSNDRFYVRGGGIEKSTLKVFNRWGQMVFESIDAPANQESYGWDGTFNGKEQEMEVYAYVLEVTYIDGSTAQRKGNVTLIR